MPGKSVDRRVQRTRQLLQDALVAVILEKGYDAATVQDVIDRANVGRSTFYAHFRDKEDLLLSGFENLHTAFETHLMSQSVNDEGPWVLSLSMFQHAEAHRNLYKAMAGKQSDKVALGYIQKFASTYLSEHFTQLLTKRRKKFPPELLSHYIASTLIALLTWWLDTDSAFTAEQMHGFYRQLIEPGVMAIVQEH